MTHAADLDWAVIERVAARDTDPAHLAMMRARVAANPGKDVMLGCPLCGVVAQQMKAAPRATQNQGQQQ